MSSRKSMMQNLFIVYFNSNKLSKGGKVAPIYFFRFLQSFKGFFIPPIIRRGGFSAPFRMTCKIDYFFFFFPGSCPAICACLVWRAFFSRSCILDMKPFFVEAVAFICSRSKGGRNFLL